MTTTTTTSSKLNPVAAHLVQTNLEPLPGSAKLHLFQANQLGEDAQKLQVAGGSDVVVARQLRQELDRVLGHRLVNLLTHHHLHVPCGSHRATLIVIMIRCSTSTAQCPQHDSSKHFTREKYVIFALYRISASGLCGMEK